MPVCAEPLAVNELPVCVHACDVIAVPLKWFQM